jgi:hypothetical protein
MGIWSDLLGTTKAYFKIGGKTGVRLKNSSGNLLVRNTGDSADAEITASKANISGNAIDLNSDAAGSGADWKYTLQRPSSGMTEAVTLTLPIDNGTPGQVLATDGDGNLSFVSAANTGHADKLDTTSLAFNSASPLSLFSTGAGDIIDYIEVIVDTAFDGTPSLSIGVAGTASKYMGAGDVDLTDVATTVFQVHPGLPAQGVEALIATYAAGGATAGAARIIVHYATPA